jgi:alkanesulfonate monooxygenase SsuD/methylene tetrahydromethanopterin reductase-like flavin-dependent oxidoreductase (luciferase family)
VDFGFGLINCQRYPGDPRSDEDLYREALDLVALAEQQGFDSAWLSEHHFFDDAYMSALLPVAAAMAARTSRIRIGTALLLAPLYDALRLAEDVATIDLLSQRRFILGLGQGWREEEFEAFRAPINKRHRYLEDTVTVLRQAWGDGLVTGGNTISYPGVYVTPKPATPGGVPTWIGAFAEKAIRRAGRIGDGFIAAELTPEMFADQVRWIREELERADRDPDDYTYAVALPTFAWNEGDAWSKVRDHRYYLWWKYEDMRDARGKRGPLSPPPPLPAQVEQELLAEYNIGTPAEVADKIARFRDAAGPDFHYIAWLYYPGFDPVFQREAMAVFAEEVMPLLTD